MPKEFNLIEFQERVIATTLRHKGQRGWYLLRARWFKELMKHGYTDLQAHQILYDAWDMAELRKRAA